MSFNGFYGNVVFACGAIAGNDGRVVIYYGASDESYCWSSYFSKKNNVNF